MTQPNAAVWNRRSALSLGFASAATILLGCSTTDTNATTNENDDDLAKIGKVIVVGAGPAGLATAHLLQQQGVEVEVLEAKPTHGGRTRHDLTFVDFPIPLGAEWVHVEAGVLGEIVNDDAVSVGTKLVAYGEDAQLGWYENGLEFSPLDDLADDLKFAGSGWLDFLDTYIVPGIVDRIRYNTEITAISHDEDGVRLTDAGGAVHSADRAVVTVPLKLLQDRVVEFDPPLETDRLKVIDEAVVWSGLKAFFVFDEAFYPTVVTMPGDETNAGQRLYYDAAYGQDTDFNVLGLFSVGHWAEFYQAMSDDALVAAVLAELDEIFDGAASRSYVRHVVQDWNADPFARGAYLEDDAPSSISRRLAQPVTDRLYFAGDAYTRFDDWSSVHTATRSAADTVDQLLRLGE